MNNKTNIYNAIQNLYNMDKTTWQEVLAELYNLVNNVNQKFEYVETKFLTNLGEETTFAIKNMYDNGMLGQLINETLLKDINDKVDEVEADILMTLTDYMGENNKKVETINEQLDNKANIVNGVYYIDDFLNSPMVDSVLFKNAVEEINSLGGGELKLKAKTYTFDSLINFDVNLKNIDIVGVTNSTIIKLTSADYGIIFNKPLLRVKFKNIRFELSDTNKGIYFPYTNSFSYHVYFENCNFYGGINNITVEHGAYFYFEKSTFTVSVNAVDDSRITLGSKVNTSSYNEYIYFKNCNIDGQQGMGKGNGINVHHCEYLIIDSCDIPNWYGDASNGTRVNGCGINLEAYGRLWDIYILNCSIPRCNVGINVYAKTSSIQKVFIDKLYDFTPKTDWCKDSRVIKTSREGSYAINWLVVDKLNILPDSSYKRTYDLELAYINYGYVENIGDDILFSKNSCNFFDIKLMRTELRKSKKKLINDSNLTLTVDSEITIVSSELNNSTLSLSSIDGGDNGYICYIYPKSSNKLTLVNNTNIVLKGGVDKLLTTSDRITLIYMDNKWYEF